MKTFDIILWRYWNIYGSYLEIDFSKCMNYIKLWPIRYNLKCIKYIFVKLSFSSATWNNCLCLKRWLEGLIKFDMLSVLSVI